MDALSKQTEILNKEIEEIDKKLSDLYKQKRAAKEIEEEDEFREGIQKLEAKWKELNNMRKKLASQLSAGMQQQPCFAIHLAIFNSSQLSICEPQASFKIIVKMSQVIWTMQFSLFKVKGLSCHLEILLLS